MEEKLQKFIADNSFDLSSESRRVSDDNLMKILSNGSARFVHHQIMEMAADILQKSRDDLLSSVYFYDLSQNLDELLLEVRKNLFYFIASHFLSYRCTFNN